MHLKLSNRIRPDYHRLMNTKLSQKGALYRPVKKMQDATVNEWHLLINNQRHVAAAGCATRSIKRPLKSVFIIGLIARAADRPSRTPHAAPDACAPAVPSRANACATFLPTIIWTI
ncbi:hypothetical protein EVAR_100683_1 [Eumeta japonica]|uniref:Uncharacterized protein n=1 Tax=Eumeta variegata TaxID=151549 RepID=A0A4C1ZP36_EUMVA|nr:hypothetical protein EVAR_100683_1 [Eumeta japonica]